MGKIYYLGSIDSRLLQECRECIFDRFLKFNTGKDAVIASIDPPIQIEIDGSWTLFKKILVTTHYEGDDIKNIVSFPFYVYVALPPENINIVDIKTIEKQALFIVGVAGLFSTEEDCKKYVSTFPL
jgi:hypothetical protein